MSSKNYYYRDVIFGAVLGMAFLSFIFVFASPGEDVKPVSALEPKGKFEVVDKYKGCDVVQWTNGMQSEYKYFLDCTDDMRNK